MNYNTHLQPCNPISTLNACACAGLPCCPSLSWVPPAGYADTAARSHESKHRSGLCPLDVHGCLSLSPQSPFCRHPHRPGTSLCQSRRAQSPLIPVQWMVAKVVGWAAAVVVAWVGFVGAKEGTVEVGEWKNSNGTHPLTRLRGTNSGICLCQYRRVCCTRREICTSLGRMLSTVPNIPHPTTLHSSQPCTSINIAVG